jgi:hypothetical protein
VTHDETRFLLGRFSRCFGRKRADAETVEEWAGFLADVPANVASEQLNRFVTEGHVGPSLPVFLERCRAEMRRLSVLHHPASEPVEDPPVSLERARQHIATIRAQLARAAERDKVSAGIRHAGGDDDDAEDLW